MIWVVVAVLIVVSLHLVVDVYLNLWGVATLERSISRQDDRLRKRAEREVAEDDEDNLGQIADGLRAFGETSPLAGTPADVLERHPDARRPEEL